MHKKFWPAFGIVAVAGIVLDLLIYAVILAGAIESEPAFRAVFAGPWPKLIAASIIFAFVFVWLYTKGLESKPPLGQGLRFGLAVGILYHVAGGLVVAVLVPSGEWLVIAPMILGVIKVAIQGVLAAVIVGGPSEVPSGGPAVM
jgi:hypothetical protein